MLLKRKDFINTVNSNDIWGRKLDLKQTLDLLSFLEGELNKYDYKIDDIFIMDGRRDGLKQDIESKLSRTDVDSKTIVSECLFNLWEFISNEYTGSVIKAAQELGLTPEKIDSMCLEYRNKGIICKQEKEIIVDMINNMRKYINNIIQNEYRDRFTYEAGDVELRESICHFCENYNNGLRSNLCPMNIIDDILKAKVICPNFKKTK